MSVERGPFYLRLKMLTSSIAGRSVDNLACSINFIFEPTFSKFKVGVEVAQIQIRRHFWIVSMKTYFWWIRRFILWGIFDISYGHPFHHCPLSGSALRIDVPLGNALGLGMHYLLINLWVMPYLNQNKNKKRSGLAIIIRFSAILHTK